MAESESMPSPTPPARGAALEETTDYSDCRTPAEWLECTRKRRRETHHHEEWVQTVGELAAACRSWLALSSTWAKEVAVNFNREPASVVLYVVLQPGLEILLEHRRQVAEMGLLLGGCFGIRCEARPMTGRPAECSFVVE